MFSLGQCWFSNLSSEILVFSYRVLEIVLSVRVHRDRLGGGWCSPSSGLLPCRFPWQVADEMHERGYSRFLKQLQVLLTLTHHVKEHGWLVPHYSRAGREELKRPPDHSSDRPAPNETGTGLGNYRSPQITWKAEHFTQKLCEPIPMSSGAELQGILVFGQL